jgi:hypothetical protein
VIKRNFFSVWRRTLTNSTTAVCQAGELYKATVPKRWWLKERFFVFTK